MGSLRRSRKKLFSFCLEMVQWREYRHPSRCFSHSRTLLIRDDNLYCQQVRIIYFCTLHYGYYSHNLFVTYGDRVNKNYESFSHVNKDVLYNVIWWKYFWVIKTFIYQKFQEELELCESSRAFLVIHKRFRYFRVYFF